MLYASNLVRFSFEEVIRWIGTSELLDEGIEKLASAADGEPGEYFLYNGGTGLVVATLQKMVAGPTRIIRYWT